MTQTWPRPSAPIPPPHPTPRLTGLETGCPDHQAKTPGMMLRREEAAKVCFKGQGVGVGGKGYGGEGAGGLQLA